MWEAPCRCIVCHLLHRNGREKGHHDALVGVFVCGFVCGVFLFCVRVEVVRVASNIVRKVRKYMGESSVDSTKKGVFTPCGT